MRTRNARPAPRPGKPSSYRQFPACRRRQAAARQAMHSFIGKIVNLRTSARRGKVACHAGRWWSRRRCGVCDCWSVVGVGGWASGLAVGRDATGVQVPVSERRSPGVKGVAVADQFRGRALPVGTPRPSPVRRERPVASRSGDGAHLAPYPPTTVLTLRHRPTRATEATRPRPPPARRQHHKHPSGPQRTSVPRHPRRRRQSVDHGRGPGIPRRARCPTRPGRHSAGRCTAFGRGDAGAGERSVLDEDGQIRPAGSCPSGDSTSPRRGEIVAGQPRQVC